MDPVPPVTNCHTFSDPLPLERDVLYGRPLGRKKCRDRDSWRGLQRHERRRLRRGQRGIDSGRERQRRKNAKRGRERKEKIYLAKRGRKRESWRDFRKLMYIDCITEREREREREREKERGGEREKKKRIERAHRQ